METPPRRSDAAPPPSLSPGTPASSAGLLARAYLRLRSTSQPQLPSGQVEGGRIEWISPPTRVSMVNAPETEEE
ncbi:MAG: hypothetical protein DHS20C21_05200 [Gemmatimonadota bacterium]|nr:MAG: hypothetical protein DHS20C21_05200 [Gemmatimonadota bacterium]